MVVKDRLEVCQKQSLCRDYQPCAFVLKATREAREAPWAVMLVTMGPTEASRHSTSNSLKPKCVFLVVSGHVVEGPVRSQRNRHHVHALKLI